jgi:hypothetical protein
MLDSVRYDFVLQASCTAQRDAEITMRSEAYCSHAGNLALLNFEEMFDSAHLLLPARSDPSSDLPA